MHRLAGVILDLVAASLPYGKNAFDELRANDPMWLFRLLHYLHTPDNTGQLGSGEHTDFVTITLLLQDEHTGLEVQDSETGEWYGVVPQEDVYIINMADIMTFNTGREYKSSVHHVINRNEDDRYSVVYFFDGNIDLDKLRPMNMGKNRGSDAPTLEKYVRDRLTKSYGEA